MTTHERFLLAEHKRRLEQAGGRGRVAQALAELRRGRPTLRQRFAGTLLALAHRLSPETVPLSRPDEPCLHA